MTGDEAMKALSTEAIGKARFATGDAYVEGRVIAYSDRPMACLATDDGGSVWWVADLVDIA